MCFHNVDFLLVRNQRYENTSTVGAKLWIESPLEDITSPKFLEYSSEKVEGTFSFDFNDNATPDEDGIYGHVHKSHPHQVWHYH